MCLIFTLGCFLLFNSSCSQTPSDEYVSKKIGITLPDCEELLYYDDHGGFHGDGRTNIILSFTEENGRKLEDMLAEDQRWSPMPLNSSVELILYGDEENHIGGCLGSFEIPHFKHGYWFFYDKQTGLHWVDYSEFRSRASHNFYVCLYDSDERILYYFGLDT